jgi:hypothetical protein
MLLLVLLLLLLFNLFDILFVCIRSASPSLRAAHNLQDSACWPCSLLLWVRLTSLQADCSSCSSWWW